MKIFDLPGMLNLNRLKNNQTEKRSSPFKTGDVIEGKILEMKEKVLMIMLDTGKLVRLQDMASNKYQLGDSVKMELVKEGDVLMGKLVDATPENSQKEELTENALKQIGLEVTDERKDVAKLLRMNGLPITKSNVLALTEAKKHVARLSDLVKNNMIDASKLPVDKNVKTILVEYLNKSDQLYDTNKSDLRVKDFIESELELAKESISQKNATEHAVPNDEGGAGKNKTTPSIVSANTYLSDKLDNVKYKSLVFNLKNNVENTVKNIVMLDKIILGNDSVTKQLGRFSKNIEYIFQKSGITENSHPKLLSLLTEFEEISLRDFDKFEETAEKLLEQLKSEPSMTTIDKDVLGAQVATIKNALSYLNDMSQNLVFIQMPVKLNNQTQNMDLYIKKNPKKKKIDPNHCSIFLSLDTEHCKTVKTLLEINRDRSSVIFKLDNEEMVSYFNEHLDELETVLKDKGYLNLQLKAIEFKKDEQQLFDDDDEYEEHIIDVKL